jgi:hypothetical protein
MVELFVLRVPDLGAFRLIRVPYTLVSFERLHRQFRRIDLRAD